MKQKFKVDDFVNDFQEKITQLNESETFQSIMTYEENPKLILNTEKKIAFEDGVSQEKVEIAKSMLQDGVMIESISKYTGLTIEEIEKIQ